MLLVCLVCTFSHDHALAILNYFYNLLKYAMYRVPSTELKSKLEMF